MNVQHGNGQTRYGPGVEIILTGDEIALAIDAYLVAHNIHIRGSRTIMINGDLCAHGLVYVDPSGFDVASGTKISGRG